MTIIYNGFRKVLNEAFMLTRMTAKITKCSQLNMYFFSNSDDRLTQFPYIGFKKPIKRLLNWTVFFSNVKEKGLHLCFNNVLSQFLNNRKVKGEI